MKAAFAKRDYQAALQLTDERLQENPGDPKYVSLKAFILFFMGRAAESLKYVNKMIEAYPENLKLLKVKVFILKKLNMNKELDLCYAECIDKYSNPLELNSLAGRTRLSLFKKKLVLFLRNIKAKSIDAHS